MSGSLILSYGTGLGNKFVCFTLFLNLRELFTSLQPDVRLRWDVD